MGEKKQVQQVKKPSAIKRWFANPENFNAVGGIRDGFDDRVAKERQQLEYLKLQLQQKKYDLSVAWNRYRMGNGPKPTEPEYPEQKHRSLPRGIKRISPRTPRLR